MHIVEPMEEYDVGPDGERRKPGIREGLSLAAIGTTFGKFLHRFRRCRVHGVTWLALLACLASPVSHAAGWVAGTISQIGIYNGNGCVYLTGGEVVLVDIATDAGKAQWSVALSAEAQHKEVRVYQTDGPLLGGCNTGTTIKPHTSLFLVGQ